MPGILPSSASSRKQMRQRLKSRMKPRGRPHLKQRRTVRDENFGVRFAFAIIDFLAIDLYAPKEVSSSCTPAYALGYRIPIRGLVSCSLPRAKSRGFPNLFSVLAKKQAPYEAQEIYARWGWKSINQTISTFISFYDNPDYGMRRSSCGQYGGSAENQMRIC